EAVRAASFFSAPEAIEGALISSEHPSDNYLDFTRAETLRALEPAVSRAIREGHEIKFTTDAGARFFLQNVGTDALLRMKRSQGVRDELRHEALAGLAKREGKGEVRVLVDAVRNHDEQPGGQDDGVAFDLVRLLTARPAVELAAVRGDLEKLAVAARQPVTRQ